MAIRLVEISVHISALVLCCELLNPSSHTSLGNTTLHGLSLSRSNGCSSITDCALAACNLHECQPDTSDTFIQLRNYLHILTVCCTAIDAQLQPSLHVHDTYTHPFSGIIVLSARDSQRLRCQVLRKIAQEGISGSCNLRNVFLAPVAPKVWSVHSVYAIVV
jgi:hypothetical protein